MISATEEMIVN